MESSACDLGRVMAKLHFKGGKKSENAEKTEEK
jgi:hypothetical protein